MSPDDRREIKSQVWGWNLFLLCASFLMSSRIRSSDALSSAGSAIFFVADGLTHLHLCRFITETQAVRQLPGLQGVRRQVSLEGFHVPQPENPVEPPVKTGEALFYFKFVYTYFSFFN
jgi:hypothetical protein